MIHPQQPECKQVPVVIVSALPVCGTYAFVWFNTSRRLQKGFKVLTDVHILKYFGFRCMYSDSKKNCPDIFQCEILHWLTRKESWYNDSTSLIGAVCERRVLHCSNLQSALGACRHPRGSKRRTGHFLYGFCLYHYQLSAYPNLEEINRWLPAELLQSWESRYRLTSVSLHWSQFPKKLTSTRNEEHSTS